MQKFIKQRLKFPFLSLILAIVFFQLVSPFAVAIENEDAMKQRGTSVSSVSMSPSEASEEKRVLDEQYKKSLAIKYEIDSNVGKILVKYSQNVKLLSNATSIEKESKIEAMKAIISLLESTQKIEDTEKSLLTYFFLKYAPYSDNQFLIQKIQNIVSGHTQTEMKVGLSYDRTAAYNYAYKYVYIYNTDSYPDLNAIGGDCSNFISQAMKAGGKSMQDSWYIYKKNGTYPKPTSTTQLNYSWTLADPSPWISASQFESYWTSKLNDATFTASYVADNQNAIWDKSYYRGDVIQILAKRWWWYEGYHTMMITAYGTKDYLMTYHTTDKKDRSLHDIAVQYKTGDYQFKFYSVQ